MLPVTSTPARPTKRFLVSLSEQEKDALRDAAMGEDRGMSEVLRSALAEYMEHHHALRLENTRRRGRPSHAHTT